MTSFYRHLLQRLAFSKSRHFSWDKDPANTMVRRPMTGCSSTSHSDSCVFHLWVATPSTPAASRHAPLAPLVWLVVVSPLVAPTPPIHRHLRLLPRCPCHLLPFSSGDHHPTCLRNTVSRAFGQMLGEKTHVRRGAINEAAAVFLLPLPCNI